ncbi:MAG: hypothetical protein HQK49_03695 [Oligoflexia bacterium]|nr:hypothetical protein [Oligoflexia bacterium]
MKIKKIFNSFYKYRYELRIFILLIIFSPTILCFFIGINEIKKKGQLIDKIELYKNSKSSDPILPLAANLYKDVEKVTSELPEIIPSLNQFKMLRTSILKNIQENVFNKKWNYHFVLFVNDLKFLSEILLQKKLFYYSDKISLSHKTALTLLLKEDKISISEKINKIEKNLELVISNKTILPSYPQLLWRLPMNFSILKTLLTLNHELNNNPGQNQNQDKDRGGIKNIGVEKILEQLKEEEKSFVEDIATPLVANENDTINSIAQLDKLKQNLYFFQNNLIDLLMNKLQNTNDKLLFIFQMGLLSFVLSLLFVLFLVVSFGRKIRVYDNNLIMSNRSCLDYSNQLNQIIAENKRSYIFKNKSSFPQILVNEKGMILDGNEQFIALWGTKDSIDWEFLFRFSENPIVFEKFLSKKNDSQSELQNKNIFYVNIRPNKSSQERKFFLDFQNIQDPKNNQDDNNQDDQEKIYLVTFVPEDLLIYSKNIYKKNLFDFVYSIERIELNSVFLEVIDNYKELIRKNDIEITIAPETVNTLEEYQSQSNLFVGCLDDIKNVLDKILNVFISFLAIQTKHSDHRYLNIEILKKSDKFYLYFRFPCVVINMEDIESKIELVDNTGSNWSLSALFEYIEEEFALYNPEIILKNQKDYSNDVSSATITMIMSDWDNILSGTSPQMYLSSNKEATA